MVPWIDSVELLKRLGMLRKDVYRIAKRTLADYSAWNAIHEIDLFKMLGKKLSIDDGEDAPHRPDLIHPIWFHSSWMIGELASKSYDTMARTSFDLQCSVVSIPMQRKNRELTLFLLYDNSPGELYRKSFKKRLKPVEFCYWNNTDQPAGMSDEDWEERREIWDEAISWDPPAERGFTFECITKFRMPIVRLDEIMAETKRIDFQTRVDRVVEEYVEGQRVKELRKQRKKFELSDIRKWTLSSAGKRATQDARKRARVRLSRTITKEDLNAPMSTIARLKKVSSSQRPTSRRKK
jgi:hypothetical protein